MGKGDGMFRWPKIFVGGLIFLFLVVTVGSITILYSNLQATQAALDELSPIVEALRLVQERYVDEVEREVLLQGALKGLVAGIDDPYCEYLTPPQWQKLQIHVQGTYGGIGVILTMLGDDLFVVEDPMPGSPAEKAGIKKGDQITSIDGTHVTEITFERAADLIRGEIGTEIRLGVKRGQEEREVIMTREEIALVTVRSQMLKAETGIGYLRISMFNDHTGVEVETALTELFAQDLQGLVLDLRGNPGGTLRAAIEVASSFLAADEPILHIQTRDGLEQTYRSEGTNWPQVPLAVLVDGGSASAAEIVAGALKDTGRGVLVGTTTFGKGSVQSVYNLSDNGALKLTTALYITSGGHSINHQGIEPDVYIEYNQETEVDDQLQRAIEVLEESL
jgi:carboxyl-terminal processing protease